MTTAENDEPLGQPPPPTDNAYRERMEALLQEAAALVRLHGLMKCDWTVEGLDHFGRLVRHRIRFEGYERTGPTAERIKARARR